MLKEFLKIFISFIRVINRFACFIYNFILLKSRKVHYSSFPVIIGRIRIGPNKGSIKLGREVKFNCSVRSNYVGIYKTCTIAVESNGLLEIGDYSGFSGVSIFCSRSIKVGNFVNCGGNVCIWDTDFHPLDFQERRIHNTLKITSKPISIGDDVFIGANAIIVKGVHIGARSIIGAGSVVTKNVPQDEVWAGNPARFIRRIKD